PYSSRFILKIEKIRPIGWFVQYYSEIRNTSPHFSCMQVDAVILFWPSAQPWPKIRFPSQSHVTGPFDLTEPSVDIRGVSK
ncbi:MAG: hypothetical protein ACERKP_06185, partial [Deltaproteobacteria bacterium]